MFFWGLGGFFLGILEFPIEIPQRGWGMTGNSKIFVIASEAKQYLGILNLFLGILNLFLGILEFILGILEFILGILDFCSLLG